MPEKLTFRTLEKSTDKQGNVFCMRRFYWKRRRIRDYFTLERASFFAATLSQPPSLKTHEVTLFGPDIEETSLAYDYKTQTYFDMFDGEEWPTLRKALGSRIRDLQELAGGR